MSSITGAVTGALPVEAEADAQLSDRRWQLKRCIGGRHSELLELEDEAGARIFVKRLRTRPGTTDGRLRREWRSLNVLRARLDRGLQDSIPQPLGLYGRGTVLIIGAVDGSPLSSVLKYEANVVTGPFRAARLTTLGAMTGEWLRRFHASTERRPVAHDHERFCRGLDASLARISAACGSAGLEAVRQRLVGASARLAGQPLAAAARHGDFLPQNVLVGRDGIHIVDLENYRVRETVHRDVGHMLAYMLMLSRRRRYHPQALRCFAVGFTTAYGERARAEAQQLFTADGAVRVARDSGSLRAKVAMCRTVTTLLPHPRDNKDAGTA
jgi:hypothetical protein